MEYCFFSVFLFSFLSLCIFDVQDFWNIVFLQVLLGCFFLVFSSFLNFCMFDVQEFGNIGHLRVFSKFFGFLHVFFHGMFSKTSGMCYFGAS